MLFTSEPSLQPDYMFFKMHKSVSAKLEIHKLTLSGDLSVAVHVCNLSTREAKARGLGVKDQPGLYSE